MALGARWLPFVGPLLKCVEYLLHAMRLPLRFMWRTWKKVNRHVENTTFEDETRWSYKVDDDS